MGWLELQARHSKLVERRTAQRSDAMWKAHRSEGHQLRQRGAH